VRVAIAGGSGFLGRHLLRALREHGHEPLLITRGGEQHSVPFVTWERLAHDPACMDGVEAIINLAGETINQRWTSSARERILRSRLEATAALIHWVQQTEEKPAVFLQGSAIGCYGASDTAVFTEETAADGTDFLAHVVSQWEQEAERITGVRLVKLRTGVVLGRDGGAFGKMLLPYKLCAGGPIASGKQWMSWIHVHDWTALVLYLLEHRELAGPVNITAPEPVQNDTFGRTLGKVMRRPHWMPVPAPMLRLLFGDMAQLLTEGQRVLPQRALRAGFAYRYPDLESALQALIKVEPS